MKSRLEDFRHEWSSPDGFVRSVIEGRWDMSRFTRIESLMREVCEQLEDVESVDRWVLEAFYDVCIWVPRESAAAAELPGPPGYYEAAAERLDQIFDWFCRGRSMYTSGHTWEPL